MEGFMCVDLKNRLKRRNMLKFMCVAQMWAVWGIILLLEEGRWAF